MSKYILMNKDRNMGRAEISDTSCKLICYDKRLDNIMRDPGRWLIDRVCFPDRTPIDNLCKIMGVTDVPSYINKTHAVSVTDCFWLQTEEEYNNKELSWEIVNPYNKPVDKQSVEIALTGKSLTADKSLDIYNPQIRLRGSVNKCIECNEAGELILVKGNIHNDTYNMTKKPYISYICSNIANQLGLSNYVKYDIQENIVSAGYVKPYSICKLYTNRNISSISLRHSHFCRYNLTDLIEHFESIDLALSAQVIREMMLLDSLTLNPSRHIDSIEFLYNPETFDIIGIAPIFNTDNALGIMQDIDNRTIRGCYEELYYTSPRVWTSNFDNLAKLVMTDKLKAKLLKLDVKQLGLDRLTGLSDKRKKYIEYILETRRATLLKI